MLLWLPRALMACYDGSKAGQSALSLSSCSPLPVPSSKSGMDIYIYIHIYIYTRLEGGHREGNGLWSYLLTRRAHGAKQARKKQKKCRAHIVAIFPLSGNFIGAKEKSRGKQNCPFAFRASGGVSRASSAGRSVRAHAERQEGGGVQERRNFFSFFFLRSQHGISYKKERRV